MSQQHLEIPAVFFGDGETVQKGLKKSIRAITRGKPIQEAMDLTPSKFSEDASKLINLSDSTFSDDVFHMGFFAVELFSSLAEDRMKDFKGPKYEEKLLKQSELFEELTRYRWGVISLISALNCAVWLMKPPIYLGDIDPEKVNKLIKGLIEITPSLKSMGRRFVTSGLDTQGEYVFAVHSVVTFLAARNDLPQPASWEEWDATLEQLLKVKDWRQKVQH